jgi:hypothetical protein
MRQVLVAYETDSGCDPTTGFNDPNWVVGVNQLLLVIPIEGVSIDDLTGIANNMDAVVCLHIVGRIIDRSAFRSKNTGMEPQFVIEIDFDARIEKGIVLLVIRTNPSCKQNCTQLAIVREAYRRMIADLRRDILPGTWVNARLDLGLLRATDTQLNC